jgi:hypothetical protein
MFEHFLGTAGNACVEDIARWAEKNTFEVFSSSRTFGSPVAALCGGRLSSKERDFDGTREVAAVLWVDGGGTFGVEKEEFVLEFLY